MARRTEYPETWLTLRQQRRGIVKWAPFLSCRIRRGVLNCNGIVRPTPLSRSFQIDIDYRLGLPPEVRVTAPTLEQHSDWAYIPHLNHDGSLCLFFPDLREWGPHRQVAKTIVPWTALWLFYYEAWLATGELGGWGGHPAPVNQQRFIDRPFLLSHAANDAGAWRGSCVFHNSLLHPASRRLMKILFKYSRPNAA